jgi:hypothetical protein
MEDCGREIPVNGNTIRLTMKPFEILALRLHTRLDPQP